MAYTIGLKKRKSEMVLTLGVDRVERFLREGEAGLAALQTTLESFVGTGAEVHDKRWLMTIVNHTPIDERTGQPKPVPLTAVAPWFKIADRVAKLDEKKEGSFTISEFEGKLIWQRLTSPEFKIQSTPAPFVAFILDLQEALGKTFEGQEFEGWDE